MTLTEYLNQEIPKRHPTVYLTADDLTIGHTYKLPNGEKRTRVWINTNNELLKGIEYCLIGTLLYTTDSDGNPKNGSVFRYITK